MRRLFSTLIVITGAALAAGPVLARPMLRPAVSVEDNVIRLGDLFTEAGPQASEVVAPAPPAGSRTIFDADWLAAAAHEHGLSWEPQSRFDRASVERATRVIGGDALANRVLEEIGRQQPLDGARLQLDDPGVRLLVARGAADRIAVESLDLDARSGRFSAIVSAPADDPTAERARVSGRLIRMANLPVLNRPIAPGETIAARDVETLSLRADRVGADVIVDARELVGKTPRRLLHAHEALRSGDVQTPIVVRKGDLVTIVLEAPGMRLTAQGKALEDAGMHAAIRVSNTKSNRIIDARVVGSDLVAVAAPAQLAAR